MKQPEDDALLRDMLDFARKAINAAEGRQRSDLDSDDLFAAARERFIEIIGEAADRVSSATREQLPTVP